jgi:hypothetical protein
MAGSFAEARAQILSLRPAVLRTKAGEVRRFGSASISAGTALRGSADRLGAQRGAPYQAYRERVSPTAGWLNDLGRPTADTGAAIENAAGAAERAQMVLAQQEEALARFAVNPSTTAAAFAAAEAQALAVLNGAIGEVTQSYSGILPPPPTPAPVVAAGASGGASAGAGAGLGGAVGGAANGLAAGLSNGAGATAGATEGAERGAGAAGTVGSAVGAALGPTSGPFAGFVQDPTTGNLIDPATGRQADAGGRFLDPITGEPFGPASPFVSRLEGLDGGVSPVGGLLGGVPGGPGALAPVGGAGAGGVGTGAFGAGGAGFFPGAAAPFLGGGAAGIGAAAGRSRGGSAPFAALYGGALPPSLSGNNPAAAQLRAQAAENLGVMAGTAQRYSAIASGQTASGQATPGAYLPPMAGVGGGMAAGGNAPRRGRSGLRTAEPSSVWGAVGGSGGRPERRRTPSRSSTDVEDESVWGAGALAPRSLDAC